MRESAIEARVRRWCRANDIICWKFVSPGNRGVPDRIFIGPDGRIAFVEFKAPGRKPTALQLDTLSQLRVRNVIAFWSDDYDTIITRLRDNLLR